jgi:hypothetical protein
MELSENTKKKLLFNEVYLHIESLNDKSNKKCKQFIEDVQKKYNMCIDTKMFFDLICSLIYTVNRSTLDIFCSSISPNILENDLFETFMIDLKYKNINAVLYIIEYFNINISESYFDSSHIMNLISIFKFCEKMEIHLLFTNKFINFVCTPAIYTFFANDLINQRVSEIYGIWDIHYFSAIKNVNKYFKKICKNDYDILMKYKQNLGGCKFEIVEYNLTEKEIKYMNDRGINNVVDNDVTQEEKYDDIFYMNDVYNEIDHIEYSNMSI